MSSIMRSRRGWVLGLALLLGTATLAYAQLGGMRGNPPQARREFTQKEVQADALVETCNDLSKQNWEVFQIIPGIWEVSQTSITGHRVIPTSYKVLGRRP